MSIHDFWNPKPGNVTQGGNTRVPGEPEPEVLKSHKQEAQQQELQFVRDLLNKNNLTPAEVLKNDQLIIWAEKEFRRGKGYLFGTAEEYIKILDEEIKKKRIKIK